MGTRRYTKNEVRTILVNAYPDKSEKEIEDMVEETMALYLAEAEEEEE